MAKNDNLLEASKKVMELAAKRRARMSAGAKPAVKAAPPKVKAEAVEAPAEAVVETAPVAEVAPAPEAVVAPAVVVEQVAAKATPVKAAEIENGGFHANLKPVGSPGADVGEEDWGAHIPPEIESEVADGKSDDESAIPGILIPKGLEDMVMAVVDPDSFTGDDAVRFDLMPFIPEEAVTTQDVLLAGAHWVLFANGDPLAKISLGDQEHADKIVAHFVTADFARSIVDGISKHGLSQTLSAVKAKPYVAKIDEAKKIEQIRAKMEATAEEALRQKITSIKAKYVENLGLVLEASANNFIVENPVKDGFVAAMVNLGVPEASAAEIVDDVFFQYGQRTLAGFLDKAEAWSNTSPEALVEIKAAMQSAGRRARPLPSNMGAAHTNPNYNQQLANQMAASAVPVVSASAQPSVSAGLRTVTPGQTSAGARAQLRSKIGRFSTY